MNIDHLEVMRSGGADSPSGFYVKRAADNKVLCSATNGVDQNYPFVADKCGGLANHTGFSVYMIAQDLATGGWGKVYIRSIQFKSADGNVIAPSLTRITGY